MGNIPSVDKLVEQLTNQTKKTREISFWKQSITVEGAQGAGSLLWRVDGFPAIGVAPATGVGTIPTKDTAGALFIGNAAGGENSYITDIEVGGANNKLLMLIDILWFNSGLSGTVATPQTINSTALTRYTGTDSVGNMLATVCWTATGTTASNVVVTYTDQDGNASTTPTVALWTGGYGGGTLAPTANQVQLLPFADGDSGIRGVTDLDLSVSTGTAGDFGCMIFRPLVMLSIMTTEYTARPLVLSTPELPEKLDDACLALIDFTNGSPTGIIYGNINVVEA